MKRLSMDGHFRLNKKSLIKLTKGVDVIKLFSLSLERANVWHTGGQVFQACQIFAGVARSTSYRGAQILHSGGL
jgi:hypothetical protein